jgi:hypothetical protein
VDKMKSGQYVTASGPILYIYIYIYIYVCVCVCVSNGVAFKISAFDPHSLYLCLSSDSHNKQSLLTQMP